MTDEQTPDIPPAAEPVYGEEPASSSSSSSSDEATQEPASSSSDGATHYCPVCGRNYPEDGACAVDHPNVDHLEPIENKPADLKDPREQAEETA